MDTLQAKQLTERILNDEPFKKLLPSIRGVSNGALKLAWTNNDVAALELNNNIIDFCDAVLEGRQERTMETIQWLAGNGYHIWSV